MRKFILLSLFWCCSYFVSAQKSKWAVTFTPSVAQSSDFKYVFQPGVEYSINDRLSLLTEIGFITGKTKDPGFSNNKFFRLKHELRYYSTESKHGLQNYIGLQLSYVYRKWENTSGGCFFDRKMYADSTIGYDKATINSPVVTTSLQFGAPFSFGEHFGMDIFMGMGLRIIFTKYSAIENATKADYIMAKCKIFPAPDPAWYVNGTMKRFHCNFGVRFNYRF